MRLLAGTFSASMVFWGVEEAKSRLGPGFLGAIKLADCGVLLFSRFGFVLERTAVWDEEPVATAVKDWRFLAVFT